MGAKADPRETMQDLTKFSQGTERLDPPPYLTGAGHLWTSPPGVCRPTALMENTMEFYILDDDHNPIPTGYQEYVDYLKSKDGIPIVCKTQILNVEISTVFLGINHSMLHEAPVLFETVIFGGDHDQYQQRYHTWAEAEAGHKEACTMVMREAFFKQMLGLIMEETEKEE